MVGLLLGVSGVALLIGPVASVWESSLGVAASLALVLQAILWAIATLHIDRHRWLGTPFDLLPWSILVATIPVFVAALILEPGIGIAWGPGPVLIILYSGPLATAFANWTSQSITRSLGPVTAGVALLATPVVGLASGSILLHEPLSPLDLAAFTLVLLGVGATAIRPDVGP